jgi:hypothetical protein
MAPAVAVLHRIIKGTNRAAPKESRGGPVNRSDAG